MIISTADFIPDKKIVAVLGVVEGSTIRAKNLGSDILAALKTIVGGEIKGYSKMLETSRKEALQRMEDEAKKMGADAAINVRFATSAIMANAAEILAYGTAVKLN